jgi:hypothetical protein
MQEDMKQVFRNNGKSLTGVESSILDILKSAASPLSPKEIRGLISLKNRTLRQFTETCRLWNLLGLSIA